MIRFDPPDVDAVIKRLTAAMSDDALRQHVEAPLAAAAASFQALPDSIRTQGAFLHAIGCFIRHLYRHGLTASRGLSDSQARAEAIELLTQGYRNATDSGFEAALLDAISPASDRVDLVFAHLAEIIKERERHRYSRYVLVKELESLVWSTQCTVVQRLLEQMLPVLPPELANRSPAQLVDEIPNLIALHAQTEALLAGLAKGLSGFRFGC